MVMIVDICTQGLETGSRKVAAHAVRQLDTIFVFKSAYEPDSEENRLMGAHLVRHGDGVKDVAFSVEDLDAIVARAKEKGVSVALALQLICRAGHFRCFLINFFNNKK